MSASTHIQYGTRELPNGKHGIAVDVIRNGHTETQDRNTTPWPTRAIALDRAKRAAEAAGEQENILDIRAASPLDR